MAERPRPTWQKLGIHEGEIITLVEAPSGWKLWPIPPTVRVSNDRPAPPNAFVLAFFRQASELSDLGELATAIFPGGAIWAAWPRKAGGHASDLTDQVVRAAALALGLVDVKVAMIDEDWSGLRLVWRVENRPSGRPR